MIVLPIAGLALARFNLRRGQGDRAGALRVALFFLVLALTGLAFQAHHSMKFLYEWRALSWQVAAATFWALITGTIYIAIEPYVRRKWPQILISSARLLVGRFTDPMVGRDVLLGAAAAAIAILVWQATHLVVGGAAFFTAPETLGPARFVVSIFATTLAESVLRAIGMVILLVILRAVIPNDTVAAILTTILIASMALSDTYGPVWLRVIYAGSVAILAVLLAKRAGILSVVSFVFFILLQQRLPFTLDTTAWFFARSAVGMLVLTVFIACAFRISVGTRRWLPRVAVE